MDSSSKSNYSYNKGRLDMISRAGVIFNLFRRAKIMILSLYCQPTQKQI